MAKIKQSDIEHLSNNDIRKALTAKNYNEYPNELKHIVFDFSLHVRIYK